jgi:hypothetical protein
MAASMTSEPIMGDSARNEKFVLKPINAPITVGIIVKLSIR